MTPGFWQKIEEIFEAAVEIPTADERERYLAEVCAGDEELKSEVEKLLKQDAEAENLLSAPLMDNSGLHLLATIIEERDPMIGRQIGAYRLAKEIGRGGMGAVYLAERADGSFRQQTAVKLIKRGMDTDFILRRFRQERQILASLSHPYIARLLDGGTTEDDLPFFVMEFIEGKSLYKFADANKLSIAERLRLFRQVCQAIEFAHQNQVIHRDIKPSNILVTSSGVPKLLDFGIAKVLSDELGADITIEPTATAMRLMTPEYASPEQVSGAPVTPASDIYSLGVLLYELLTGHRPYRFTNRAPHEIARVICEEEPDRPSTSVTRNDNLLPTGASEATTLIDVYLLRGAANLEDLRRELSGDLEKIILKTLRKEAGERYQTATELADDITKYLEGKPVAAESFSTTIAIIEQTPPKQSDGTKSLAVLPLKILNLSPNTETTGDEFLSVGLADAMITRLSGIRRLAVRPTSSISRYGDENTNPLQAGKELAVDFVLDGRIKILGKKIRVSLQLLDVKQSTSIWANQFDEQFTDALELEDKISERVAEILLPHLTDTEKRQIKKRGTENAEAFDAYLRGRFFWNKFTPEFLPKALELFQRAVALDPNYAMAHASLADFYNWAGIYGIIPNEVSYAQAKAAALRALEIDPDLAEAIAALGLVTSGVEWNFPEAEKLYLRAIELHPNYSLAYEWYAAHLVGTGRFDKGVKMIHRAEESNPLSLRAMTLTAWTLYQAGHFSEAVAKAERIAQLDPNFPQAHAQLGNALMHIGRTEEAVAAARRAESLMPNTAITKYLVCFALVADNQYEEARKVLREIETLAAETYVKPYFLAMAYTALDERDKAYEFFVKAFDERDQWLNWFGTEAKLEHLRREPRFIELFRRTKNPLAEKLAGENRPVKKQTKTSGEKSIAVLPLKLISASEGEDTGDNYLCIGLADAMITRLSNVRRFVVRPTSSVLQYNKKNTDAFEAGRELGVDFILDGNLRRVGNRIRISAQLLSVKDNSTRWAQSFDENFSDVLTLEDTVAEQVAKSLLPFLTGEEQVRLKKRGTDNPNAFEAYLRGRFYWNQFTPETFMKVAESFQKAIALDPNYALAHVGLAEFYIWANIYSLLPESECFPKANAALERALEVDAELGEAYTVQGLYKTFHFEWKEAEASYKKALELNPNYSFTHEWYADCLVATGRTELGIEEMRRAEQLDTLSLRVMTLTAWTLYQARRFDESLAKAEQVINLDKNYPQGHFQRANSLLQFGRNEEALSSARRAVELMPNAPLPQYTLCFALARNNRREEARQVLEALKEQAKSAYVKPYFLAMAHFALDEADAAFALLETSFDNQDPWLLWFGTEPLLDAWRDDARYIRLFKRTNNPLAEKQTKKSQPAKREKSIAVLPLTLLGASENEDTGDNYLCIGLADAMITRLSNVRRFIVRPTSSVFPYAKRQIDAFEAGRELGVDFVLDGNLRRVGDRIRISAQLLSIADNATRWAQSFDEKLVDALALEDTVAEQVAKSILQHLTGEEQKQIKKRGTDNPQAFEAYLRGRFYWNTFTEEGFAKALIFYNEAIAIAPDYALAYAGIADYYNLLGIYAVMPFQETSAAAKESALKAIASDENLPEGYAALGFAVFTHDFDWTEAEKNLRRAVELNPNFITGLIWLSYFLSLKGEPEESLKYIRRALKLDPLTPIVSHSINMNLYYARRYEEAITGAESFIEREPRYAPAQLFLSSIYWTQGRADEAIKLVKRAIGLLGRTTYTLTWLASAHAANGETKQAHDILEEIETLSERRYTSPYLLAMVYANLKDEEKTLEMLEKAAEIRDGRLIWLGVDPQFDDFRTNPRFQKILQLTNNPI